MADSCHASKLGHTKEKWRAQDAAGLRATALRKREFPGWSLAVLAFQGDRRDRPAAQTAFHLPIHLPAHLPAHLPTHLPRQPSAHQDT
ncbi:hypothetical protein AOQ84DRAFT_283477 [Glonium stellatum]|uniref:Uncharacterized protein n=1 Tax=Glonium stellatum TaxID=574774 RepID=A0A8E2JXH0_9PEZI|nr:hypothetical protein AOQ84DRAFT_283477 [Glonium stellatum]